MNLRQLNGIYLICLFDKVYASFATCSLLISSLNTAQVEVSTDRERELLHQVSDLQFRLVKVHQNLLLVCGHNFMYFEVYIETSFLVFVYIFLVQLIRMATLVEELQSVKIRNVHVSETVCLFAM